MSHLNRDNQGCALREPPSLEMPTCLAVLVGRILMGGGTMWNQRGKRRDREAHVKEYVLRISFNRHILNTRLNPEFRQDIHLEMGRSRCPICASMHMGREFVMSLNIIVTS